MKKIGIVITDGVGFRNFIMSDFVNEAILEFDKVFIYSGLPMECYTDCVVSPKVTIKELPIFKEGKATWFFRKWKELGHLQRHQDYYGMKDNLVSGYPKTNSIRSLLIKVLFFFTRYVHSNTSILFAEKMQFLSFSRHKITKEYVELLHRDKPTQLFFTHQRPPYLAPFLYAAIQNKIPTSTFIFSWDN